MLRSLRRFRLDRKGNIAVLFALAIVPVIGGVGAAVDYSMANSYRTDMQKALDSTALALSKILPMEQEKVEKIAMQYFQASLGSHSMTDVRLDVIPEQGKVKLRARGDYTPGIANVLGATKFELATTAEAVWSMGKVEIALVLDMSLSMETLDPARIQALRAATSDLLKVLENAARNPGDAKVGIVPFDGMINTGYTSKNTPNWIRWDWWDANAGGTNRCSISFNASSVPNGRWLKDHCENYVFTSSSSCKGASGSNNNNQKNCEKNKGTWVTTNTYGVWSTYARTNWAGCVYDRYEKDPSNNTITLNYDVLDTLPNATHPYGHASETAAQRKTKYPAAPCYATAPQAVTPLSMDWAALRTKATNLNPTGYTNIAIGLAWGWHVLSPTALFTEGAAYGTEDLTKYIILMTDGYNTKNVQMEPNACNTNGPTCPTVDARMTQVCSNIKTAGVKIYTVRLIAGNADLLRNCASTTSMYYDVQSASGLAGVFNSIGAEIASLHLAK